MPTLNRNMVVFFLKITKIPTQKGEHSCKCTELSLKQKEGINGSTFHLPCFSEGQLVLRKQRMVEPGYRNRSCTAPCSCVPVQSEIKQNQQLFTVNWSNQQLFTDNCSNQQLFTVNWSNKQLFTVNCSQVLEGPHLKKTLLQKTHTRNTNENHNVTSQTKKGTLWLSRHCAR